MGWTGITKWSRGNRPWGKGRHHFCPGLSRQCRAAEPLPNNPVGASLPCSPWEGAARLQLPRPRKRLEKPLLFIVSYSPLAPRCVPIAQRTWRISIVFLCCSRHCCCGAVWGSSAHCLLLSSAEPAVGVRFADEGRRHSGDTGRALLGLPLGDIPVHVGATRFVFDG